MITGAIVVLLGICACYWGRKVFSKDMHAMYEHSECPDRTE
jgi:hypothetical protein